MRASFAALLVVMALAGTAAANGPAGQSRGALLDELGRGRTTLDPQTGTLRFAAGTREKPAAPAARLGGRLGPGAAARAFVDRYGTLFGVRDPRHGLRARRSQAAPAGTTFVRFEQVQAGVPVIAGELIVQVDGAGNVISATGEATDSTAATAHPTLTADDAIAVARSALARHQRQTGAPASSEPELAMYDPSLVGAGGLAGTRLVWQLELSDGDGTLDEYFLVDATSGAIALRFSQLAHARQRWVCNAARSSGQVPCVSPGWTEAKPPTGATNADVRGAFDAAGDVYDFFFKRFGRDSIDGKGAKLISTVRFCGWTCGDVNAFWDGRQAVFWPGMAVDDVVAHEFGHGFTQHESDLLYYHQSGAINEALSDIFGELIDISNGSADDTAARRWQMGEGSSAGVIRDMEDPTFGGDPLYAQPDRMQSSLYWADEGDQFGVHTNSGVANKSAFLMVDGGTFNGQSVAAIGIDKAAAIWYRVATQYLWSGSDYADLGAGLNQACADLRDGATPILDGSGADTVNPIVPADCDAVAAAVLATEMALPPTVPGASAPPAPDCVSGSHALQLVDTFDTGLGAWTASRTLWTTSDTYADKPGSTLWGRTPGTASSATVRRNLGTLPADAVLTFRHAYILDHFDTMGFDGGMVEYSTDGGTTWSDAAGLFTHNGYSGTIKPGFGNPLSGRQAFVGWSPGYVTTRLDLANLAGATFQLRFVISSDTAVEDYGWFIDDVTLFTCPGATDMTPPTMSSPNADFRTGVQVGGAKPIKVNVSFTAFDANGLQSTSLQRRTNSGAYSAVAMGDPTATSVHLDYITSKTKRRQFRASATDGIGNASGWLAGGPFKVLAVQNGASALTQTGSGWRTQSSSSFYGGSVRYNTTAGAKQRLTRTMSDVAIVTTKGPNRGKFDVYVDGAYKATVDTYSATTSHRQVVFAWDFGMPGTHTIELRVLGAKNAASSGARVDLDAFLILAP